MRATSTLAAAIAAAVALSSAPGAFAATVDLEIVSVQPSRESVPVGIPTQVTYVVYVRNNGEETTGNTGSIGPVGGDGSFTTVDIKAANPGQEPEGSDNCDSPGGDNPRCRLPFLARGPAHVIEVTDTVVASTAGTLTRMFTADVLGPDSEGDVADNRASVALKAEPGALPRVSDVAVRGRPSLSARQRRRAVGKLWLTLDRDADLSVVVERRAAPGRYKPWGEWLGEGNAGANTILLLKRIGHYTHEPNDFMLRRMTAGTYRLTIVAIDGEEHRSAPVRRVFVIPRTSIGRDG